MATDTEIDAAFEAAMKRQFEETEKMMQREGLDIIESLNRRGLLFAMDWTESPKMNTPRLRKRVRERFLSGSAWCDLYTLQQAQQVCRS